MAGVGASRARLAGVVSESASKDGRLIGFHSATDAFHHWAAYKGDGRRRVQPPPAPEHPAGDHDPILHSATHAFRASFRIHEEFFVFKYDLRERIHVLASPTPGRGPDRPFVWCRALRAGSNPASSLRELAGRQRRKSSAIPMSLAIPVARSGGALRMKAIVSRGPGFRRARPTIRR